MLPIVAVGYRGYRDFGSGANVAATSHVTAPATFLLLIMVNRKILSRGK
jgi:hypothetical protein